MHKIMPNEVRMIEVAGQRFDMPALYTQPWMADDEAGRVQQQDGLSFEF